MSTFSDRIRELRKEAGLTQKELAKKLQLTNSTICDWEKERSEPNIEQLRILSIFFEVSTDYLLGLEDETGAKYYNSFNNFKAGGDVNIR